MTKTAYITVSGGFHRSAGLRLRLHVVERDGFAIGIITAGQQRKMSRHLCGIGSCACGGAGADYDLGDLDGVERAY